MLDTSDCEFSATTTSISHIANILGAVTAVNSRAVFSITDDGLNIITENSHICRVELTLEKGLFSTYTYNSPALRKQKPQEPNEDGDIPTDDGEDDDDYDDESKFTVDIVPIVESLSIVTKSQVAGSTQCTMIYKGHGHPFVLIYEDPKVTEKCEFSTYVNLDFEANSMGFDLNQDEIQLEGMIKADVLYDALKDLKVINTEEIYLYASTRNKRNKRLAIISKGEMGNSSLYLPNDRSIMDQLHITNPTKIDVSCYRFSMFNMTLRAMKLSNKCKFKRDNNILSLNLLCLFGNDLPKNYTGTIFDFKMLQLADKEEQIAFFIQENETNEEPPEDQHQQSIVSNTTTKSILDVNDLANEDRDQHERELVHDTGIDVPVFL